MFESWWDIEQKFEVFLFMCGIMEDPSPAIDHICEQYATCMKTERYGYHPQDHLFKIATEIRNKQKFLNPLCNDHIYFVWQLPLKRQSRLYHFGRNLDWLNIGDNANTTHKTHRRDRKENDCGVLIINTCLPPRDVLQVISTLRQTISYLRIYEPFVLPDEACDDIPDHIFKIDPSATYIQIKSDVVLPTAISKHLGRKISTCYNLSLLSIPNQPFIAAETTAFLGTKRYLRILDVEDCYLSENKVYKICEQLSQLSNLKYCFLSGNAVGDAVSVLSQSIKSWGTNTNLEYLYLQHCNITPRGCSRFLEALEVCTNLGHLDLSHNTIGGAFEALISKPVYPGLDTLYLNATSLTSGDIQAINSLIKENKMPRLHWLYLSYVNLDNLEMDTLETLEALNSIIQKVPIVFLWKGNNCQDLEEIQECITRGISKYTSKNATN